MTKKNSKLFVGVGVLCFVGVMALWLASSGDRAIADADQAPVITQTLTMAVDQAKVLNGKTHSNVAFAQTDGLVQRLSVYLNVQSDQAKQVMVHLTSPSGTRVLLVDGSRTKATTAKGLEGWFGTNGLQTAESLAAFAGEPVTGSWTLTVDNALSGKLVKWSLNSDVGPNTTMAGMETYGEYTGQPTTGGGSSGGGCDCQMGNGSQTAGAALTLTMLLGLVLVRRRA